MTDYNFISAFIAVVREGSFGAAARALRIEKSTLSRRVAALEESLGFPLLRRTTRKMTLTDEGRHYFTAIEPAWGSIESATHALRENRQSSATSPATITGTVRLTAPVIFGQTLLVKPIAEFCAAYPQIRVEILIDDKVLDVTAERIDLAIRGGPVELSGANARRLGYTYFRLFASPEYLRASGRITQPAQLKELRCLSYVPDQEPYPWVLVHDRDSRSRHRVKPRDFLRVNHLEMIKELCKQGVGIALMPTLLVEDELLSGELQPVLKEWGSERSAYSLVTPHSRVVSEAVRVAARFLGDRLAGVI